MCMQGWLQICCIKEACMFQVDTRGENFLEVVFQASMMIFLRFCYLCGAGEIKEMWVSSKPPLCCCSLALSCPLTPQAPDSPLPQVGQELQHLVLTSRGPLIPGSFPTGGNKIINISEIAYFKNIVWESCSPDHQGRNQIQFRGHVVSAYTDKFLLGWRATPDLQSLW